MIDSGFLFFLSSGLFLGWTLGANDAANSFGTAVGTRMISFRAAAVLGAVFITAGAIAGGGATVQGLGNLGAITALPGAFTVALSAALVIFVMTKLGLPVSTTHAIVGGILGWHYFGQVAFPVSELAAMVSTWIISPLLGAAFAFLLHFMVTLSVRLTKPHLLTIDAWTRYGYWAAGIFGAYCLGANNIANVIGVFVPAVSAAPGQIGSLAVFSAAQRLFVLGGIAMGLGVFFSRPVMMTIGRSIMTVNALDGWVVVMAQALVLFVFSSESLRGLLVHHGLPPVPLLPVSSSQAVVGAVCGIAFTRGWPGIRQIKSAVLAHIVIAWLLTPLAAMVCCYLSLFFMHNVFQLDVIRAGM